MPKKRADSGRYGYGIWKDSRGKYFIATVPKVTKGQAMKYFRSESAARTWQVVTARRIWGIERFTLLKRGRLAVLRKTGAGVSVRRTKSTRVMANGDIAEYWQYGVFWYEHDGKPKSKLFSYKRYGDNAEIEANWFAAHQRAKLTSSELNLPTHWTASTFETVSENL